MNTNKLLLTLILGMFLISFTSATVVTLGTFQVDESINLIQTCASCTYNNITSVLYPNSTQIIGEFAMTKTGSVYNFTLTSGNVTETGKYIINGIGDLDGTATVWAYDLFVTYQGKTISSSQSILYIPLFLILIFFFIIIIFGITQLPRTNQQDEDGKILSVSYLKYFRPALWFVEYMIVVGILYLSSNIAFAFLSEQLFAKTLFVLFRISFAFAPIIVIVWIIWIFVEMFHDKQLQALLNRGMFPQGKLP